MKQTRQKLLCALVFKLQCRFIRQIYDVMKRKKGRVSGNKLLKGDFGKIKVSKHYVIKNMLRNKRLLIIFKYISENQEIHSKWIRWIIKECYFTGHFRKQVVNIIVNDVKFFLIFWFFFFCFWGFLGFFFWGGG